MHQGKKSIATSFPTYQIYTSTVIKKLEIDHHTGDKWFIHGPRRHKENHLQSLKHFCGLSFFSM